VLVIGIVLWTRGSTLDRRGRCGAPSGAWLFSAALLAANSLPHVALYILLPVAGLGILWLAGFGPAAVAYLANSSETHRADRSALMSIYTVTLAAGGAIGAALVGWRSASRPSTGWWSSGSSSQCARSCCSAGAALERGLTPVRRQVSRTRRRDALVQLTCGDGGSARDSARTGRAART